MKKKLEIPKLPVKKIPYFKEGSLVFAKSGHALTLSDRNYRCILSTNQKCNLGEKQINVINLKRNFANFSLKFAIPEDQANIMSKKFLKEVFYKMIDDALEEDTQEELIDMTIAASFQDILKDGKMKKGDEMTILDSFISKQKAEAPKFIIGGIGQAISTFSHESENQGQFLAYMTKKIFLSDEGKILKIELENLGWYIVNYLDHHLGGYLWGLKNKGVTITNKNSELMGKNVYEAVEYFKYRPTEDMLSNFQPTQLLTIIDSLKFSLGMITTINPKQQSAKLAALLSAMNSNPMFQIMSPVVGLVKVKKPKRVNKGNI